MNRRRPHSAPFWEIIQLSPEHLKPRPIRLADLIDRLPSPVAFPLQSYLEESHPHLGLWAICASVELLLRLLVFVGIADLAGQDGKPPQALRAKLREPIEQPIFGGWWGMAEAVIEALERQPDSLVKFLADIRNRLAHGGGASLPLAEKRGGARTSRLQLPAESDARRGSLHAR